MRNLLIVPIMRIAYALASLAFLFATPDARAEDCPTVTPEDAIQRRQLAKSWFGSGDDLAKAGDYSGALRAYRCSLKLVPHGFTAYNVAQIAERTGDLESALSSYKQYLLLVPAARDADAVNARIAALRERLDKSRKVDRPPSAALSRDPVGLVRNDSVGTRTVADSSGRAWVWGAYGTAGALVLGGVATNLLARSRMTACRSTYEQGGRTAIAAYEAEPACDDGRRLTYTSYVFFGLGGVAAALGTYLLLRPSSSSEVAMVPLPKGGAVRWGRKF